MSSPSCTVQSSPKSLNLALQGGGAHGAYSWGVLDRLCEEPCLKISAVSGTSAGAMNAAVLADGFVKNGRRGVQDNLQQFWRRVSDLAVFSPIQSNVAERWHDRWNLDHSLAFRWFDVLARFVSPYLSNPMNLNPLRTILKETLDLERVHACRSIDIFIAATRVSDGQPRIFTADEVTIDVLLASACLPQLYQAVTIDGEDYWDGGYVGNPVIWPLIYHSETEDVLLVQINPLVRRETPRTSTEIMNRINEITFNNSLIAEMRAIYFVQKLMNEDRLDKRQYKKMHIHMIERPEEMEVLNASSKLNAGWEFLSYLHDLGWEAADIWVRQHYDQIGKDSTIDIGEVFLNKHSLLKKKAA